MKLSSNQIQTLQNYLVDKPVRRAYVFGSYARGDADEKSDLDILLELDYSQHIGLKFFLMSDELENLMKTGVDLVTNNTIHSHIQSEIEREKVLIYER